jgi:hypothetical protein
MSKIRLAEQKGLRTVALESRPELAILLLVTGNEQGLKAYSGHPVNLQK